MKACILMCFGWLLLVSMAVGQADSFPYEDWTSEDGRKIVARLTMLEAKEVTLQMKRGGKRYTLKRAKLSDESNAQIERHRASVLAEIKSGALNTSTIFRSVVLGVGPKAVEALADKTLAFSVTDIRIDTDRKAAYLELDEALFLKVQAPSNYELFEKDRALYSRPGRKDRRYDSRRTVNELARFMAREGAQYKVLFTKETLFEFGTVGITDGVIIHR